MVLEIKRESIEHLWDSCLDIVAFASLGYLCGHVVNRLTKWTSLPFLFGKSEAADLKSGSICCALFVTIDRLVLAMLNSFVGEEETHKPIYSVLRIGVNLTTAIGLFNMLASRVKLKSIEFKTASAIILTTVVVYSQTLLSLRVYNERQ